MGKILVIGSSNTDLIARVDQFPVGGETIEAESFLQAMGGKGANQAMAAHRLGGDVNFITCLGQDSYGKNTLKYYNEEGLKVSESKIVSGVSSGIAMILVDRNGENCIVITPGANDMLSSDHISEVEKAIDKVDVVVLQMEIPYETITTICAAAARKDKKVILNAAPARGVDKNLISMVDILVLNETEAEAISGKKIDLIGVEMVVDILFAMGANTVLLTLGENGCYLKDKDVQLSMPAYKVKVRDTTGAGDTFCGALAVGLAKENTWLEILEYATAASAVCVTKMGAQPSIPSEKEVCEFMKTQPLSMQNGAVDKNRIFKKIDGTC